MAQFDAVKRLREAGVQLDKLPQDQQDAMKSLSPEEVETLIRVNDRVKGDVQGFRAPADDTGVIIY
ncbi:MAG: hypothetical protein JOZ51_13820 [Chloroflexi bacterium]|nr:hypothetical protein [Chloroflexota bacterium]